MEIILLFATAVHRVAWCVHDITISCLLSFRALVRSMTDVSTDQVKVFKPYRDWYETMHGKNGLVGSCHVLMLSHTVSNVVYFGSRPGFVNLSVDAVYPESGTRLPGAVFLRGGSVAVLMLCRIEGTLHVVMVKQARVPVGKFISELPAGMMEDSGRFSNKAMQEVLEETGVVVRRSDMKLLGRDVYLSPGGCDERLTLFMCDIDSSSIDTSRTYGNSSEGERMQVHLQRVDGDLFETCEDAKFWVAWAMALRTNPSLAAEYAEGELANISVKVARTNNT
jgi:ADP-sugar diphosphatase